MATRPDFARTDLSALGSGDLSFLLERFPRGARSYEEIGTLIDELPSTLESMLESEFVVRAVLEQRNLLMDVSPFLLFNVLLRRTLRENRVRPDRRVVNYVANLLSLFVRTDRVYRVTPDDSEPRAYIVQLLEDASEADEHRRFLIHAHVGNYALFLAGMFPGWIRHRFRYGRRTVGLDFYLDFGRSYYHQAASHPLAREYGLEGVFLRLAMMFEQYVRTVDRMRREYLAIG